MDRLLRPDRLSLFFLLICVHGSLHAATMTSVQAVNALQALSWSPFATQTAQQAKEDFAAFEGATVAHKKRTCYGMGACEAYTIKLSETTLDADFGSPIGLRYGCLDANDCSSAALPGHPAPPPPNPGFRFEAPLEGGWNVRLHAKLNIDASVWGVAPLPGAVVPYYVKCCKAKDATIDLTNIRFTETTELDPAERDRPKLISAKVTAHVTVNIHGPLMRTPRAEEIEFVVTAADNGQIVFVNPAPFDVDLSFVDFGGAELPAKARGLSIRMSYDPNSLKLTAKVSGKFDVYLVEVAGKKFTIGDSFDKSITIDAPRGLLLALATAQLPKVWGESPPYQAHQPLDPGLFRTAADAIESAVVAHIPYGAVLSIDHTGLTVAKHQYRCPSGLLPLHPGHGGTPPECYNREFDSAIWTGHYLAAEAFRYAKAPSPDVLARVKNVVDGISRLFWVAEDAAVGRHGSIMASPGPGLFARTAVPSTTALADPAGPIGETQICRFERPENGWDVHVASTPPRTQHEQTYAQAATFVRDLPLLEGHLAKIVPAPGTIWMGFGCGVPDDHPISHDQYVGLIMGLAYAHALVPDPDVEKATRELITKAVDYLIRNSWDVPVPVPEQHKNLIPIGTTFLGAWDYQVGLLRIAATVNANVPAGAFDYTNLYTTYAPASKLTWIPSWTGVLDPLPGYFKFNLNHAVVGPLLFFETDDNLRANYLDWYNMIRRATRHHKNGYFDAVRILIERPADRPSALTLPSFSYSDPQMTLAEEIRTVLAEWLERTKLRHFADGLPRNDVADPQFQADLFNQHKILPYDSLTGTTSYKAPYAMPMRARNGNGFDFAWERSPFDVALSATGKGPCAVKLWPDPGAVTVTKTQIAVCGSALDNQEAPGVDYLLAYWLSAYLNVVP